MVDVLRMRRVQIVGLVLALSVATGTAAASTGFLTGEHQPAGARPVPQSAVASDSGVTVRALDATFSGTETMLRVSIDGSPIEGLSILSFDTGEANVVLSGFGSGPVRTSGLDVSQLVLQLPVVSLSDRAPTVLLRVLRGRSSSGETRVEGAWSLRLILPSDLGALLRVEDLGAKTVSADGIVLRISVRRSTSRTVVSYGLPADSVELAPPRMFDESTPQALGLEPLDAWAQTDGSRVVTFPATNFDHAVRIDLGPFATGKESPAAITVAVGNPPARSEMQPNGPRISASTVKVLDGDSALVEAAEFGLGSDGTTWVGLTLRGNWPDAPVSTPSGRQLSWRLFDKAGHELVPAFSEQNYTKDGAGAVSYGVTTIAGLYKDASDVTTISALLTRESEIRTATWSARFGP